MSTSSPEQTATKGLHNPIYAGAHVLTIPQIARRVRRDESSVIGVFLCAANAASATLNAQAMGSG
jgi:hypothetical protein